MRKTYDRFSSAKMILSQNRYNADYYYALTEILN